eukprot:11071_1
MNSLDYQMVTTDWCGKNIFTILYHKLKKSCKYVDKYFNSKRLIGFIDRRKSGSESESDIYLYLPPTNCLDIPSNACELWYLAASRTCLLGNIGYKRSDNVLDDDSFTTSVKFRDINITSRSHCKGGLLTISFHVKARNE